MLGSTLALGLSLPSHFPFSAGPRPPWLILTLDQGSLMGNKLVLPECVPTRRYRRRSDSPGSTGKTTQHLPRPRGAGGSRDQGPPPSCHHYICFIALSCALGTFTASCVPPANLLDAFPGPGPSTVPAWPGSPAPPSRSWGASGKSLNLPVPSVLKCRKAVLMEPTHPRPQAPARSHRASAGPEAQPSAWHSQCSDRSSKDAVPLPGSNPSALFSSTVPHLARWDHGSQTALRDYNQGGVDGGPGCRAPEHLGGAGGRGLGYLDLASGRTAGP